jgi:hypothetical protein
MTSVVLSPLRKQGDVSRIPAAPPAVLLQGSGAPPTAMLSRTQGSSTSSAATLACTQGSGTPLPDMLAHSYTPIVHLDPVLVSIKGRSRAFLKEVARGKRANEQALSLSRDTCNPYYEHPPARDNTFPPCVPSCANPSGQGHVAINSLVGPVEGPPGSETPTVGAPGRGLLRVNDTFPLSSRWVVSSNLFSPGHCSASGVSSSCPSTAATTWYSSPIARQRQRRPSARPAAANSTTSSPRGRRAASGFASPPSSPQEEEAGQLWPSRR